jgi:uncharacterized membrane protein
MPIELLYQLFKILIRYQYTKAFFKPVFRYPFLVLNLYLSRQQILISQF